MNYNTLRNGLQEVRDNIDELLNKIEDRIQQDVTSYSRVDLEYQYELDKKNKNNLLLYQKYISRGVKLLDRIKQEHKILEKVKYNIDIKDNIEIKVLNYYCYGNEYKDIIRKINNKEYNNLRVEGKELYLKRIFELASKEYLIDIITIKKDIGLFELEVIDHNEHKIKIEYVIGKILPIV